MLNQIPVWELWHYRNIILYVKNFQRKLFLLVCKYVLNIKKKLSNQTTSASIGLNPPEIHDKYSYDSVYVPEHFEATPESRKVLDELSSIFEKKTYEIPNIEACKHSPTKYIVLYKEKSKWNKGTVYQESYGACCSWSRRFFIKIIASRKRCCRWYSTKNQKPPWCVLC